MVPFLLLLLSVSVRGAPSASPTISLAPSPALNSTRECRVRAYCSVGCGDWYGGCNASLSCAPMDDSSDVPCCGDDGDYCGEEWGITGWIDICDCTDFFRVEGDCSIDLATGSGGTGDIYTYSSSVCVGESGPGYDTVRSIRIYPKTPEPSASPTMTPAPSLTFAPTPSPSTTHPSSHRCACMETWTAYGCTDVAGCPDPSCDGWTDSGFRWCQVEPDGCDGAEGGDGEAWWSRCDSNGTYTAEEVYALSHTPAPSAAPTISSAPSVTSAPTSMCQVRAYCSVGCYCDASIACDSMDDASDVPCCGVDGGYCGEEWGITDWIDICDCTDFFRVEGYCSIDLATGSGGSGDIYTYDSSVCVGESGPGYDAVRSIRVYLATPEPSASPTMSERAEACVNASVGACMDDGGFDSDCCATCGNGGCASGYTYFGQVRGQAQFHSDWLQSCDRLTYCGNTCCMPSDSSSSDAETWAEKEMTALLIATGVAVPLLCALGCLIGKVRTERKYARLDQSTLTDVALSASGSTQPSEATVEMSGVASPTADSPKR